jgi:DNA-binding NtrC family response regulator
MSSALQAPSGAMSDGERWADASRLALAGAGADTPLGVRIARASRAAEALVASGRDAQADEVLGEICRAATASGDARAVARVELLLAWVAGLRDEDGRAEAHLAMARRRCAWPRTMRDRAWLVSVALARRAGRPPPVVRAGGATYHDAVDAAEAVQLEAELALERAARSRAAKQWGDACELLRRAADRALHAETPRLAVLVGIETALLEAARGDRGAAARWFRSAIELALERALARDAGRAMLRYAAFLARDPGGASADCAATWFARGRATLGAAATWRDRVAIQAGFCEVGHRLPDRCGGDTPSGIETFEEGEGSARPPAHRVDDRDRLRELLRVIGEADRAPDAAALEAAAPSLVARVVDADCAVMVLERRGKLVCVARFGGPLPEAEEGWRSAIAATIGGSSDAQASGCEQVTAVEPSRLGSSMVLPLRAGGLIGALYADRLRPRAAFSEPERELGSVAAQCIGLALGRLRAQEEERRALLRLEAATIAAAAGSGREQRRPQRIAAPRTRYRFRDLIGRSPALLTALEMARRAAELDGTALITGESGTGKEVLAQAIHSEGARADAPFVAINCASLPRDLLEAELFGYERGAFTGAKPDGNAGKFELAGRGTILLDEIGEMPLEMQPKLLRVLQERVVTRLGGNRELPVGARVIATTHRCLERLAAEGRFRTDLFYRLRVLVIELPSLRERREDISLLARHHLRRCAEQQRKRVVEVHPRVVDELETHDWPGNVRELANVMEAEVSVLPPDARVLERLATRIGDRRAPGASPAGAARPAQDASGAAAILPLEEVEKRAFLEALARCRNNVAKAAQALGVSKVTFYSRLRSWGMHPRDPALPSRREFSE